MSTHLVYTTGGDTVTIDYNETLQLFLTQKEHLSFSAGKLLQMLNWRTDDACVVPTGVGLRISVGEVCCVLTQRATNALATLYRCSNDLQAEFPCLHRLFATEKWEGVSF
jgi:hypothetical protein